MAEAESERAATAGTAPDRELPVFDDRARVPRDLRTGPELAANGLLRLGAPRALLRQGSGLEPLFSTSEARLLRDALWPRGARAGSAQPNATTTAPNAARPARDPPRAPREPMPGRGHPHAGRNLDELFREGFVVLDTETTGLSTGDEVIEIGLLDSEGGVLLESKVFPRSGHVPAAATRVHGYTIDDLRGAPSWPEVMIELERHLEGRRVFAWNAPFDERMVAQSTRRWRLTSAVGGFECAMRTYSAVRGVRGSLRLERAAQIEGVLVGGGQSHTSVDDARLTLAVMRRLRRAGPGRA